MKIDYLKLQHWSDCEDLNDRVEKRGIFIWNSSDKVRIELVNLIKIFKTSTKALKVNNWKRTYTHFWDKNRRWKHWLAGPVSCWKRNSRVDENQNRHAYNILKEKCNIYLKEKYIIFFFILPFIANFPFRSSFN